MIEPARVSDDPAAQIAHLCSQHSHGRFATVAELNGSGCGRVHVDYDEV